MSSVSETLTNIQNEAAPYIYYTELFLGFISCSMNILLFSRRQFRTMSISISSVAMWTTLSTGVISCIYTIHYADPSVTSVFYCKFRNYLQIFAYMIMRWSLAFACLDRVALSSSNIRWHSFSKVHVAYRVVAIMIVTWLILPVPSLFYYNIKGPICAAIYNRATQYYHPIFIIITGFIIPVSIMIISAFLIYNNLVKKRKRRQLMNTQQQQQEIRNQTNNQQRKRDRQVLWILLCQSIAYICATIPWLIYLTYSTIAVSVTNKSSERLVIERFAYFLVEPIQYLFPMSSFYLYVMTSSMYRKEFIMLIRSLLPQRWFNNNNNNNRIIPITDSSNKRIVNGPQIQLKTTEEVMNPSENIPTPATGIIIK
ncbi:unnamed protein product [Adineta steineri]|uniref:G-protein coupled receptors family 1 profile domain-containing protein n=1 Tax=Adineta steineri TaxID=433720 RepID=A0A813Q0I5_9BILA|nr:unnamed protein product [Adineta steineri]CAF4070592.1 unnamed protein product [Adineta steineri]